MLVNFCFDNVLYTSCCMGWQRTVNKTNKQQPSLFNPWLTGATALSARPATRVSTSLVFTVGYVYLIVEEMQMQNAVP